MICKQLTEITNFLVQLNPQPSLLDVSRAVCGCCHQQDSCPSLSLEQAEQIEQERQGKPISQGLFTESS